MTISLEIIIAAIATLFIVQSIKLTTDKIKSNFNIKNILTSYGGMPSSHTAIVASLCTIVGYYAGIDSLIFGLCVIFSLIIVADAMVLRGYIDRNSASLKKIMETLPSEEQKKLMPIITKLKHTFPQVLVGAMLGIVIGYLVQLIF